MIRTIYLKHALSLAVAAPPGESRAERIHQVDGEAYMTESGTVILTGTEAEPIIGITTSWDVHRKATVRLHTVRARELTIPSHNVAAIEDGGQR